MQLKLDFLARRLYWPAGTELAQQKADNRNDGSEEPDSLIFHPYISRKTGVISKTNGSAWALK